MTAITAILTLTLGRQVTLTTAGRAHLVHDPRGAANTLRALRRHWLPLWARQGTPQGQALRCATACALRSLHAARYPRPPYSMPVSMVLSADTVDVCRALQGDGTAL